MSIQVNANANAVSWESLLGAIQGAKTGETQGVGETRSVTFTTMVDGVATPVTVNIPDDLELPKEVDAAAIDSLCAKLSADTGLGLSEDQVKQIHDTLTKTLEEVSAAAGDTAATAKTVMFDIYKLMSLLVEVAQKQRDASREMRLAENAMVQHSIQSQADAQRTAALTGMIAGALCCTIQIIASTVALGKQGKAFKTELDTLETSGLNSAKQQLNTDVAKLEQMQSDVMFDADKRGGVPLTPEAREAAITEMKTKIETDRAKVNEAMGMRQADASYLKARFAIQQGEAYNGMITAIGNTAQSFVSHLTQLQQAEATEMGAQQQKSMEELDQTKDLFNQAEELVNQVVQLMRAVISAETQSMRDAIQV